MRPVRIPVGIGPPPPPSKAHERGDARTPERALGVARGRLLVPADPAAASRPAARLEAVANAAAGDECGKAPKPAGEAICEAVGEATNEATKGREQARALVPLAPLLLLHRPLPPLQSLPRALGWRDGGGVLREALHALTGMAQAARRKQRGRPLRTSSSFLMQKSQR